MRERFGESSVASWREDVSGDGLRLWRGIALGVVVGLLVAAGSRGQEQGKEGAKPAACPEAWRGLVAQYRDGERKVIVAEEAGRLTIREGERTGVIEETSESGSFVAQWAGGLKEAVRFDRDGDGWSLRMTLGGRLMKRDTPADNAGTFQVVPVRDVMELRREALAAMPPMEAGTFRANELVDLATVAPGVKYDIRYATTNNFLGTAFYSSARAFLQRPAAEALARAHESLRPQGYGLLVHDAYRPWYVTKMFWEGVPASARGFVANPRSGSKHNRGCAVDLTLYELATGEPVEMVSGYDEFSDRAAAEFPGGTSLQRWHRALLRQAMEAEGFRVISTEWWHFDYQDWRSYGLANEPFERIGGGG